MPVGKEELLRFLERRGIDYALHEHEPVFTAQEALKVCGHIPGVHCKNLFLKDKADALWLVTLPEENSRGRLRQMHCASPTGSRPMQPVWLFPR